MVHVLVILCTKCLSAVNLGQMLSEEHPFGSNVDHNCWDKNSFSQGCSFLRPYGKRRTSRRISAAVPHLITIFFTGK